MEVIPSEFESHETSDTSPETIVPKLKEENVDSIKTAEDCMEKSSMESVPETISDYAEDTIEMSDAECILKQPAVSFNNVHKKCEQNTILFDTEKKETKRKTVTINVSMDKVQTLLSKSKKHSKDREECIFDGRPRVRFYAEIDPSKNKNAEQELSKEISKDMFSKVCHVYPSSQFISKPKSNVLLLLSTFPLCLRWKSLVSSTWDLLSPN